MFHEWGWNKDIFKQAKMVVGQKQTFTKGSSKGNNLDRKKVISDKRFKKKLGMQNKTK